MVSRSGSLFNFQKKAIWKHDFVRLNVGSVICNYCRLKINIDINCLNYHLAHVFGHDIKMCPNAMSKVEQKMKATFALID